MRKGTIAVLLIIFSSYLGCGTAKDYIGVIKDRGVANEISATEDVVSVTSIRYVIEFPDGDLVLCVEYSLPEQKEFSEGYASFISDLFEASAAAKTNEIVSDHYGMSCNEVMEIEPAASCDEIVYTAEKETLWEVDYKDKNEGATPSDNLLWFSQKDVDSLIANINIYSDKMDKEEMCEGADARPFPDAE